MYLPHDIPNARVLITVKTYPLPSNKYGELVCTAGLLPDGKWIRLYPIPFLALPSDAQYSKYYWVTLDLVKNTDDFRPESYRPSRGAEYLQIGERVDTKDYWSERKQYVCREVFTSMGELIERARGEEHKSLGTLKPSEIIDFVIEEEEDREWPQKWRDYLLQQQLFDPYQRGEGQRKTVLRKLPYKYSYKFLSAGDQQPRQLMIEDWELGRLYWRSLEFCGGDEQEANRKVKQKYYYEFLSKNDLYLFLGTTLEYHRRRASNPFIIIGLFYPLKPKEASEKKGKPKLIDPSYVHQPPLFEM